MSRLPATAAPLIGELVENFAFLIPNGTGPLPPASAWDVLLAVPWQRIDTGARGRVLIGLTEGSAAEAARNILGLDPQDEVDTSARRDAAGELANILAGNLLPHLFGDGDGYNLGQPASVPPFDLVDPVCFDLGEGFLGVSVEESP